jgi:PAS domain S-box-containing protein
MTRHEIEDPAHWFTQRQVDRFNDILVKQTGNVNISREAGQYSTSAKGLGPVKQIVLGLIDPTSAYLLMKKIYPLLSRGAHTSARKLDINRVEIISKPKPGVNEKPFQCENRLGSFESLARYFTGKFANVEHPSCFHRGDDDCRYIITWEKTRSFILKRIRRYLLHLGIMTFLVLFFYMPPFNWSYVLLIYISAVLVLSVFAQRLENKELTQTIMQQGEEAQKSLNEIEIRYNTALLIQEIGQATATILNVEKLVETVVKLMESRLDFDRGVIMFADQQKTRLLYTAGYGYSHEAEQLLRDTAFHLDNPDSKGLFVVAFKEQKPALINKIDESKGEFSEKSQQLIEKMDITSLICVPIIYEDESLGILSVDNVKSKRILTQSDMNLLMGIASQTAISMMNAISFKQVQQSEKRYRTTLESIDEGYYEVDLHGKFTFINSSICKILGYTETELIGMTYREYTTPKTAGKIYKTFNEVYRTGRPLKVMDFELFKKDKTKTNCEMSAYLRHDQEKSPVGYRGVVRDVTERIASETEKKQLQYRLQQAQKMEAIGTLAGGVAHDLNNILSGLVSYPDLLLMELPDESPLKRPLLTIKKSGEKAAAIVQDLLTLARRGVTVTEVINLNHVILEYLASPEFEKLKYYHPDLTIKTELDPELFNMLGSPVHLSKTIMNLISNSAEAMPDGGTVHLTTENCYIDQPILGLEKVGKGDFVVLTISDTGIGIPPEDIERIFEPFYTKKVMGRSGTGLGMAVVWGTIKDHHGFIDIQSQEGKGTKFKIYLPITRKELEKEAPAVSLENYRGQGESILVVDDVKEQREITSGMLSKLGYLATSISSGEKAIEYMKNHSVDLIVLDMIMEPGINGLETYEQILDFHPDQKAIIASGFSETDQVRKALKLGAGTYLKKPYTIEKIAMAVRNELDK